MSLRQRVPFKFSDDGTEDDHILDEQEQEELIEKLRQQSDAATRQYTALVQIVIALSCLLHIIYLIKRDKESPLYALLSYDSPSEAIPLSTLFATMHILLHLNLGLLLLPSAHSAIRFLSSLPPSLGRFTPLPVPVPHAITLITPALAPVLALLLMREWPEIVWWSITGGLTWFVYNVRRWVIENEEEIRELEGPFKNQWFGSRSL
ncbi:predicted protein [Postia placenta Mad-698-R]|nr:predicted protein [Postia placenta Mad-698-R]